MVGRGCDGEVAGGGVVVVVVVDVGHSLLRYSLFILHPLIIFLRILHTKGNSALSIHSRQILSASHFPSPTHLIVPLDTLVSSGTL